MSIQAITPISDAELDAVSAGRRRGGDQTNVAVGTIQTNLAVQLALLNFDDVDQRITQVNSFSQGG